MHGRSAAQPRVGTPNCQLFKNYLRYLLEILAQYGRHVDPTVYQRRTKSVHRWHCNWCWCTYTFSPTQTLFSLLLHLNIYLYIYPTPIYVYIYTLNKGKQKFPEVYRLTITPYVYSKQNMNLCSVPYLMKIPAIKCFH